MEWILLGTLMLAGLLVLALVVGTLGLVFWLIALPFRMLGWLLGAAVFGVKCLFLAPLICLGLCALLVAAPFVFLLVAIF